ncbi:MAG: transposase [Bacteroidales bacterium]
MKKSGFTESRISAALKEYESGGRAEDICRELGVNPNTIYNWKKRYSGVDSAMLRRYKELEAENARLKRVYADLGLDHRLLKDVIEKKF